MIAREATEESKIDNILLEKFNHKIKNKIPHWNDDGSGPTIANPTELVDITDKLIECGRVEYGLDLSGKNVKVFGKLESGMPGGSVKVRPAIRIIDDAINSGKLSTKQVVFEATSGNFGLALGLMVELGLDVVALVSKKLQDGVLQELKSIGVKTVDLDIDICPARGLSVDTSVLVSKVAASRVRDQLAHYRFDVSVFDRSRAEIEKILAREDVIELAKYLANIYGGFCPEQYENDLNVGVHETLTGPEIEQQLLAVGDSLADFLVVCTFGTGGTSGGLSRYVRGRFGKKSVHVVFPLSSQDVAGIRTREKALGLKFYEPGRYAGQHEVDFEAARRALRFFVSRGVDIGESSALSLYATLQLINYGVGQRFVVILADGIKKYKKSVEISKPEARGSRQVTVQAAASNLADYAGVLWTHQGFIPSSEGIKLIASSLGCDESKIKVAGAGEVARFYASQQMAESFRKLLPDARGKLLLVCMSGSVSLRLAQLLEKKGVEAESLTGGIAGLSATSGIETSELVEPA